MPNVLEFGARRSAAGKPAIVQALSARVGERLTLAFRETLTSCDDILFGHAQRAVDGVRQARYFDDLRQLRLSQEAATQAFAVACRTAVETGALDSVSMPRRADDPLQLVADEDLEFDLALFRVGKRCDDVAPRQRHQIQRRLEIVYGLGDGAATPLGGAMIAKMCRAGMAPLDIGLESRLIVLKQVERHLATALEALLDPVNALLLDHGILPNLRHAPAVAARSVAPAPTQAGPSSPAPPSSTTAEAPASTPDLHQFGEVLQRMTQWMAQQTQVDAEHPAATTTAASDVVDADDSGDHAARERRRLEVADRRAAERERARELRLAAERSADGVVAMVLTQTHVPECIGQVVRGPLRRHLETVHARRGDTSTEWRSACKLVRDIAWALDPETAVSEQAHWCAMVPGIVSALRAALLGVGTDEAEVDRIVAEFGDRYERMLGGREASPVEATDDATATPDIAPETTPAPTTDRVLPSFGDALRQARQLTLGRWFELPDDQGTLQRAKLVWTSAMTERCLFVNSQGKLVADRPHARVANDILSGQFREIDAGEVAPA